MATQCLKSGIDVWYGCSAREIQFAREEDIELGVLHLQHEAKEVVVGGNNIFTDIQIVVRPEFVASARYPFVSQTL